MGMFAAKKYFYLMGVFCFLLASSSLHLWADEGSPGKVSSEQQKAEGRQEKAPAQNQPRISIDAISFDAGEVWEGDTVSHTFTVKNTGTAELEIKKVKTGWGCTVASFDKAIPPGQEGNITIRVSTGKREGRFSKSATVFSNDPKQPTTKISVSCLVKNYITIRPSQRITLTGFEGEKISQELTISSSEEQPFEITDIGCDIKDKIKYKLKTVKKGREYTLKVSNRSTEGNNFRGKIVLKTTNPKKLQITLPVYGMLKKEVDIRPKTLSFGTINITEGNFDTKKLTKRIVLVDNRGKGLTIKKVKPSSDWIMTETKTKKEGKNHTILIVLDKDKLPKGPFNERIKIRTNYKRKYLVVDLKGKVI